MALSEPLPRPAHSLDTRLSYSTSQMTLIDQLKGELSLLVLQLQLASRIEQTDASTAPSFAQNVADEPVSSRAELTCYMKYPRASLTPSSFPLRFPNSKRAVRPSTAAKLPSSLSNLSGGSSAAQGISSETYSADGGQPTTMPNKLRRSSGGAQARWDHEVS